MSHLVVSITGHGFGHVAQTAPVLNLLHERMPHLRLTVRSSVPAAHLRSRIHTPFAHLPSAGDIGMAMLSPLDIDVEQSRTTYRSFHADWDARVEREAALLRELGADMVLSNVGYLPLAGAQRAGIVNAALCSLNWADIYRHYLGQDDIHTQIRNCYAEADVFLRTTPGMAMDDLLNLVLLAPLADIGDNRRDELNRHLRLSDDERLVLVSLGGIASRLPMDRWPRLDGVRWLVQASWQVRHPDAVVLESLHMPFGDLLASCDALLSKPGYGSFVEAACNGTPVLFASRADWPESAALVEWLQKHGVCREVSRDALESGNIADDLAMLRDVPQPQRPEPTGAAQAADWLLGRYVL